MIFTKFDQFLREVLKLPTAVFEGPSFGYTEHAVRTCFPQQVGAPTPGAGHDGAGCGGPRAAGAVGRVGCAGRGWWYTL